MNIGIDIRSLTGSVKTGVGEYTVELISSILKQDKKNNYYLFYNSLKEDISTSQFPKVENVYYIKTSWPNKLLSGSLFLFKRPYLNKIISKNLVKEVEIDLFYSPNIHFTSIGPKIPHILTIHDLSFVFFKDFFSIKRRIWHKCVRVRRQCKKASLILTPSENTKNDVVNYFGVGEKKIKVIKPGLSTLFLKQDTESVQKIKIKYGLPEKFVFFLGTIEPRKNIDGVVDAFLLWQRKNSYAQEYELIIAGAQGWKCLKLLERIGKNKKIKYVGYISPEEKRVFYELASIFVYPSFYEGFGFPVLEAMSVGTPVITSSRSSLPEVVGNSAFMVNPHDIAEIAKGMQLLTSDYYLRNELIDRGYKKSYEFSWVKSAEQWIEALSSVI
ncbi:MAG: glycosyltransferase family 4 protein [Candidatus Magasanikbacteria bacterium]|nr:glycosyltransferase family 4 protein [Candidatus Magasanikbacteria bacterium]